MARPKGPAGPSRSRFAGVPANGLTANGQRRKVKADKGLAQPALSGRAASRACKGRFRGLAASQPKTLAHVGEGFRRRSAEGRRSLPRMTPHHTLASHARPARAPRPASHADGPGLDGMLELTGSDRMALAMSGPPRSPSSHARSDEPDNSDGLDLSELLASRGLSHWKGLIEDLTARYAGWLTDYWCDDQFDLDLWPEADVIKVLVGMPPANRGDDLAFARALAECDFLVRLARDLKTGRPWDPLSQSYREFAATHEVEPYWGLQAPWAPAAFAYWAVARLASLQTGSTGSTGNA